MLYIRNHVRSLLPVEQEVDLLKVKKEEMLVSICESVFLKHETFSNQYQKLKYRGNGKSLSPRFFVLEV
jgi:hypothetical protein